MKSIIAVALMVTASACSGRPVADPHAGKHPVEYAHCMDRSKSDAKMREFGYELLSTEHYDDFQLQHWNLKRRNPRLPMRVELRTDSTDSCIEDTDW